MILKKPFALLIKNFRLIHLILGIFICYIVYRTSAISTFFNEYIINPTSLIDPKQTRELCGFLLYIIPLLLIMGYIVIMILMRFKKKPITFYFISILICIFSIVTYAFANSTLTTIEINLVDVRTLKLNQDFIHTTLILQFICAIITLVRATGFNIKKFDFTKDLEQLDIEEADNEEFEVNVEVDSNSYKTKFRRFRRYTKYILIENKIAIMITTSIVTLVIGILIYTNVFINNKIYKQEELITTNDFAFKIGTTYQTIYDYRGKEEENMGYIIADFTLKNLYNVKQKLETTRLSLQINDHLFYHDRGLTDSFFDLGYGYQNSKIGAEFETYSLVFKVPRTFMEDPMHLVYDEEGKKIRTSIKPKELLKAGESKTYKLNQNVDFKDSVLYNSNMKIETIEIGQIFKKPYRFCLNANTCYDSEEVIVPSFAGNFDKTLLKIKGTVLLDKNINVKGINDLDDFIHKFGTIHYQMSNGSQITVDKIVTKTPKHGEADDTYYIECNRDIENASHIWIDFTIRDQAYRYNLK